VDQAGEGTVALSLLSPVSAITPGQSVVIYDGMRVLGGGFIC
jgi:tRNA U34 2-thiouridine synthase MnmA/TrmU